jgi:LysR family transcriptional regulator, low CO2-responsive transcriptional regulator
MSVSHAQLKAFHAVAVHGSFTLAAERLFLTQPAISDQVRKLEERFGVLLFHRNKRSVRLTDLGERLLSITQRLFVIAAEAQELLQDSKALQTGSLTLAVDAPVHVLPQIARFCQRYPGITVKIETGNTDECAVRGCSTTRRTWRCWGVTSNDERLLSVPLRERPDGGVCGPQRTLGPVATSIEPGRSGRHALGTARSGLRDPANPGSAKCSQAGLRIRPAIQVEGREAAREAVVVGIGVGVVSAAGVRF